MIKLATLEKTCFACPSQWHGMTDSGLYFYARYRYGWLSVEVGKETILEKRIGDSLDGLLEDDDLKIHLADLVDFSGITWIPERNGIEDGFQTHSEDSE